MSYPSDPAKRAAARAKRAARYQANKDRAAAQNAAWRAANAKRKAEMDRAYAKANPEVNKRATAKYRVNNPEKVRASSDTWLAKNPGYKEAHGRARYQANKALFYENSKRWRAANPERAVAIGRKNAHNMRILRKLRRPAHWGEFDKFAFAEAFELAARREVFSGFKWHVDHLIPLLAKEASGLHCAVNLQVIPARLNLAKRNRLMLTEPFEWLRVELQNVI